MWVAVGSTLMSVAVTSTKSDVTKKKNHGTKNNNHKQASYRKPTIHGNVRLFREKA